MRTAICIIALSVLSWSGPVHASLIQDVFLKETQGGGEEGGPIISTVTQIGTLQFTTDSSTDAGASIVQADILFGGIQFGQAELKSSSWEIDSNWEFSNFNFVFKSPNFGDLTAGGYDLTLSYDQFNPSGLTGGLVSSSRGCDMVQNCLDETNAVITDAVTLIHQDIPAFAPRHDVPAPATLALFGLGLAGIGFFRRRTV